MRCVLATLLLMATPCFADEQTFTFRFTVSQTNIVIRALNNAPYGEVAPIIEEIKKQAITQTNVPEPKK